MAATLSSLAPLRIGSTVLAVENLALSAGIVSELHQHSGQLYPTADRISGASPRLTFSTPFLAAYNLIGLTVLSASTLDIYLTKYGSLIPTAGSTHPRLALAASCTAACHITGASVNQDGILMADVEVFPLSNDGTTHPLVYTTTNALPTQASQPTKHTLGPCTINGATLPGVGGLQVDLGQQMMAERADGALYPIVAARVGGQPRITIPHRDPFTLLSTLGLTGVNISSNFVAYARPYDDTTNVVTTAATAISFTIASGRAKPVELSASQGAVATLGIEIAGLSSSATHPIAVASNATAPSVA